MAYETIGVTAGSGENVALDTISGTSFQRVKVAVGAEGSATDVSDANPMPIDDAGGSITVDGTVTANLSATDNAVLDTIETNTDFGAVVGGGAEATALRVTIANDSTGLVSVDDGGASLTVDSAALDAIQTAVELIDNAISGTEMQVDVVGALPAGTNNIGDVDVASIAAGETHIGEVGGKTVTPSGSVTRPADTTAYAAGDAISDSTSAPTAASVSGCARVNGGSGVILRAILIDSANQATKGDFKVYLFSEAHTATNDNAAWAPSDADIESYYIGRIDFGDTPDVLNAASGASGNCAYDSEQVAIPFKAGSGSTSLYWQLVARNSYTPVSAEKFTLRLSIAQD